jgi:hypothetical protein
MPPFRFPWTPVPEEELIDRLRRTLAFWDRWRYWSIVAHIGLLAAVLSLYVLGGQVFMRLGQNGNLALLGFAAGALMGMVLGWATAGIIHGLIFSIAGFQSERLLLRYYDSVHDAQSAEESGGDPDIESDDNSDCEAD